MAGIYDTSALCLAALRRYIREPSAVTGSWPQDPDLYAFLTDAENAVKQDLAPRIPHVLNQQTAMTTADGGLTYTFGTDSEGNAIYPLGQVEVFAQAADVPYYPLRPYEDFIPEGDNIRMPNNAPRTFPSGGPVARFIPLTLKIDGSTNPTLLPFQLRELVVIEAARRYAIAAKQGDLAAAASQDYAVALQRNLTVFQTQYSTAGMAAVRTRPNARGRSRRYWRGR